MKAICPELKFECVHSKYIIHDNGILEIQLADDYYFTIKDSKEITANIISITNGIPNKVMVVAGNLALCDEEARNYASTEESTNPITALAIVTNSLPQTIIANFIMKFQKPRIPTKVFNSVSNALQWLRSH